MDPICCLLGICCPPAERRTKVIAYFVTLGATEDAAAAIADDLIKRLDSSVVGSFVRYVKEHKK